MGLTIHGVEGGSGVQGSGTINTIPLWTNLTILGDSQLRQSGVAIINGASDPDAGGADTFRTIGGIVSDTGIGDRNTRIGRGVALQSQANARNVGIGDTLSVLGVNALENVVIGFNLTLPNQGGSVVLGTNINWGATGGPAVIIAPNAAAMANPGVAIGAGLSNGGTGVLIGNQAISGAVGNFVGVGRLAAVSAQFQVSVGDNAQGLAGDTGAIQIGANTRSRGPNTLTIGAQNIGVFDVLIGEGLLSSGVAPDFHRRHTSSQGTNAVAGNVFFDGSIGTGNAIGGGFVFNVGERRATSDFFGQVSSAAFEVEGGSQNVGVVSTIGGGVVGDYGGGVGVFRIGPALTAPTGSPVSGYVLFVDPADGILKARGTLGTITPLAIP